MQRFDLDFFGGLFGLLFRLTSAFGMSGGIGPVTCQSGGIGPVTCQSGGIGPVTSG